MKIEDTEKVLRCITRLWNELEGFTRAEFDLFSNYKAEQLIKIAQMDMTAAVIVYAQICQKYVLHPESKFNLRMENITNLRFWQEWFEYCLRVMEEYSIDSTDLHKLWFDWEVLSHFIK